VANPRIVDASAQTVHSGSSGSKVRMVESAAQIVQRSAPGGRLRLAEAFAQLVHQGATGSRVLVAESTVQVVTFSQAGSLRVGEAHAQVVRHGGIGAVVRESFGALQVLYTVGVADDARRRAWTFDFDGHTFYVLDLGGTGALIYDLTTDQWSKFDTNGFDGVWDFRNGFHWRTGKMVVGGSTIGATVRKLTPDVFLDEGWRPVTYEVRGLLPVAGNDFHRQYALRLIGSSGQTADDVDPVLHMQFSDDHGVTWSVEHSITLLQDTRQRIEFRSLGAFTAPGRIFRLYDDGGIKFLAYVEADMGGEDGSTPS
jgi:hypothetical protein